jgi:hypothetical protein
MLVCVRCRCVWALRSPGACLLVAQVQSLHIPGCRRFAAGCVHPVNPQPPEGVYDMHGPAPRKRTSQGVARPCRLAGLASLGPPSSRGRFGGLALPFAGATRPCVGRARTSRRVPPAGLRCAVSPSPPLRLFRPVSRPVFGFGVSGSASLCVA